MRKFPFCEAGFSAEEVLAKADFIIITYIGSISDLF